MVFHRLLSFETHKKKIYFYNFICNTTTTSKFILTARPILFTTPLQNRKNGLLSYKTRLSELPHHRISINKQIQLPEKEEEEIFRGSVSPMTKRLGMTQIIKRPARAAPAPVDVSAAQLTPISLL